MIIGHLPAGYLAAAALDEAFDEDPVIFWGVLVGAVLPDLDMLWYFFVDGGAVHHHTYLTHDPTFWLAILGIGAVLASRLMIGLGIGAVMHMGLDTITGGIAWGFGDLSFTGPLIAVPPTQSHWLMSFLLHWTILFDLMLWVGAGAVFWRRRGRERE